MLHRKYRSVDFRLGPWERLQRNIGLSSKYTDSDRAQRNQIRLFTVIYILFHILILFKNQSPLFIFWIALNISVFVILLPKFFFAKIQDEAATPQTFFEKLARPVPEVIEKPIKKTEKTKKEKPKEVYPLETQPSSTKVAKTYFRDFSPHSNRLQQTQDTFISNPAFVSSFEELTQIEEKVENIKPLGLIKHRDLSKISEAKIESSASHSENSDIDSPVRSSAIKVTEIKNEKIYKTQKQHEWFKACEAFLSMPPEEREKLAPKEKPSLGLSPEKSPEKEAPKGGLLSQTAKPDAGAGAAPTTQKTGLFGTQPKPAETTTKPSEATTAGTATASQETQSKTTAEKPPTQETKTTGGIFGKATPGGGLFTKTTPTTGAIGPTGTTGTTGGLLGNTGTSGGLLKTTTGTQPTVNTDTKPIPSTIGGPSSIFSSLGPQSTSQQQQQQPIKTGGLDTTSKNDFSQGQASANVAKSDQTFVEYFKLRAKVVTEVENFIQAEMNRTDVRKMERIPMLQPFITEIRPKLIATFSNTFGSVFENAKIIIDMFNKNLNNKEIYYGLMYYVVEKLLDGCENNLDKEEKLGAYFRIVLMLVINNKVNGLVEYILLKIAHEIPVLGGIEPKKIAGMSNNDFLKLVGFKFSGNERESYKSFDKRMKSYSYVYFMLSTMRLEDVLNEIPEEDKTPELMQGAPSVLRSKLNYNWIYWGFIKFFVKLPVTMNTGHILLSFIASSAYEQRRQPDQVTKLMKVLYSRLLPQLEKFGPTIQDSVEKKDFEGSKLVAIKDRLKKFNDGDINGMRILTPIDEIPQKKVKVDDDK